MTEFIITIVVNWLLACVVIPSFMGVMVAHYEDCTYKVVFRHPDLHWLYTSIRFAIMIPFGWNIYNVSSFCSNYGWLAHGIIFFLMSFLFTWSLFYNGFQYMTRRKLSGGTVYAKGFFAEKEKKAKIGENDAVFDLSFKTRLIFFIFGTIFIFGIIISSIHS